MLRGDGNFLTNVETGQVCLSVFTLSCQIALDVLDDIIFLYHCDVKNVLFVEHSTLLPYFLKGRGVFSFSHA